MMTEIVTSLSSTSSELITGVGDVITGLLEVVAGIFSGDGESTGTA